MKVQYKKSIRENNRTEFLLINFDYIDGGDYLSRLFCKEYGMSIEEKFDGIYFSTIRLKSKDANYELLWHEDVGNSIYSLYENEESIELLEKRLGVVLEQLNLLLQSLKSKRVENK